MLGLVWLTQMQKKDGSWEFDGSMPTTPTYHANELGNNRRVSTRLSLHDLALDECFLEYHATCVCHLGAPSSTDATLDSAFDNLTGL